MIEAAKAYFLARRYANDYLGARSISRIGAEINGLWLFTPIGAKNKDWLVSVSKETGEVSVFVKSKRQKELRASKAFRLYDKDLRHGEPPHIRGWVIAGAIIVFVLFFPAFLGNQGNGALDVAAVLLLPALAIFVPLVILATSRMK